MSLTPEVIAGIKETLSCAVIGGVIGTAIYGITVLQTYTYFRRYSKDSLTLKALVGALFVFDTTTTVCTSIGLYRYLVFDFLRPDKMAVVSPELALENGVTVCIAFLTQCFFGHRLYGFSKNIWLAGSIFFSAIVAFGTGMAITVHLFTKTDIYSLGGLDIRVLSGFTNGFSVVADIFIAGGLCWYLQAGRSGFKRTDSIVDKLMVYAIHRGALTSICQLGHLISAVGFPGRFLFIPFAWVQGKLYTNTLLATLNVRKALRQAGTSEGGLEFSMGSRPRADDEEGVTTIRFNLPQDSKVTSTNYSSTYGPTASYGTTLDGKLIFLVPGSTAVVTY